MLLRRLLRTCTFAAAGCSGACAGAPPAALPQTVVLSLGHTASIDAIGLHLTLLGVKDDRCPVDVQCVWAGHATVRVRAKVGDGAEETLELGTAAPASMDLPGDANIGRYRLHLVRLEPGRTQAGVPESDYRATVEASAAE